VVGDENARVNKLTATVRRRLELELMAGPLCRAQLLALGLGDPDIRRLVRRGHLRHVFGLYVAGATDPDFARASAAFRAFSGSVLSHFSAARLLGLRTWVDTGRNGGPPADAVWLTRPPRSARRERRPDVVLRTAGLPPTDHRHHNRVRITTPARTAVDLARELPAREALVTMDHVLATYATRAELTEVLDRQAGWPGTRRARSALAMADPRSESALESIARAGFRTAGLPAPVPQASFWTGRGWTAERVDLWWPQFTTFAEADGMAKYEAATPAERRRRMRRAFAREQYLADLGLEFVRFGWGGRRTNSLRAGRPPPRGLRPRRPPTRRRRVARPRRARLPGRRLISAWHPYQPFRGRILVGGGAMQA
jgi:AbiEi antitoxin C-terminal domain